MSPDALSLTLYIGVVFLLSGLVKGVVGMGFPTIAIALLGLVLPPAGAAALLIVPSLVANVWQMLAGPALAALARRLVTMMLGVALGTALTIGVLTGASSGLARAALGAILLGYGVYGLWGWGFQVSAAAQARWSPLVGLVTGLIAGATGVFAIPAVPYLNAIGLTRDELIQALGLSFTVSTAALALALAASGQYSVAAATGSLFAVLPSVAGMFVGQRLRQKISPATFRRWFFVGLTLLGLSMLAKALHSAWVAG